MRRVVPSVLAALVVGACGGGESGPFPLAGSSGGPERVIRGWADALRGGDVAKAGSFFTLPAVVSNGTPPVTVRTRSQLRGFNTALPCGAEVLRTVTHHGFVIAEFRLVDRRGPGAVAPCPGRGNKAATAFRIAGGKIREWRRVSSFPGSPAPAPATGDET